MQTHNGSDMNTPNAQLMHSSTPAVAPKSPKTKARLSRTDSRYWKDKLKKVISGSGTQNPNYSIHIAHLGKRMRFPLGTPNADAAAKRAQEIFLSLKTNGWESTLAAFKPKSAKPTQTATIGEF